MSKLYDDLMNIIDFELDKDEEIRTEKYFKCMNKILDFRNVFPSMLLLFVLFLYWFGGAMGCFLYAILATVCLILYKSYKSRYRAGIDTIINECNFNKALTAHMVMARYARRAKEAEALLPATGITLFYLGKFDEAKKVMDLVEKYCDTPVANAHKVSLYAMIARYKMDSEAVKLYAKELEKLVPQANTPYITNAYNTVSRYSLFMEVEENGDYAKAWELLKENGKNTVLQKVNSNYRLYKIAKVAGLEEEASKHRAFVLENGGDSFFRKELEATNATTNTKY